MANDDHNEIAKDFDTAVNMTPSELEGWLETDESKSVGWAGGEPKSDPGGKESVGHKSGELIVAIKRKKKAALTEADYAHMKKVVGYVHRHLAQKPSGDVEHSRWRQSLMNWGHDPMKR
ncbi:DUF3140 domain-containing protein [Caulobacter sp. S45]|uniref:DUF3140 domain-containing protein n=1 Tax=Caulobacter sp. S45 TaxID=1641861 RepID=UPI00157603BE|nr:DUF3140 domain-containing protein [Caulobacter sp. S45]